MLKKRLTYQWEHYRGSLGGVWEVWRENKYKNFFHLPWSKVTLPHCMNASDAVDPDMKYYQGPGWYRTMLEVENTYPSGRTLLHFEGAGQQSTVYVHTEETGRHVGGYDEFIVDITEAVERAKLHPLYGGKVPVAVLTDSSRDLQTIPSDISDFNLYGGLYRHVNLIYAPLISLNSVHVRVNCASHQQAEVQVKARLYNPQNQTDRLKLTVTLNDPSGSEIGSYEVLTEPWEQMKELISTTIVLPELWSPDAPNLYHCTVRLESVHGATEHQERFGVRYFAFERKGPFLLNGERLLLNGTHRHEDHAGVGAAMTDEMIRSELQLIKEMGANFLRLGHYQQSRLVLDLCDELGLLVWEEIPWCRGGLGNEEYRRLCRGMLDRMIDQHMNHPSIIIWGLGNENDWAGDFESFDKQEIRDFMTSLHEQAHEKDPHRLTGIRRCEFCRDVVDVYAPSIWAGWYRGVYKEYETYIRREFDKSEGFIHLEWGADNMTGRHVEKPYTGLREIEVGETAEELTGDYLMSGGEPRVSLLGDWSETYFCDLVDWHLKTQEKMDWLSGSAQWTFKDFATPVRPNNPIPYVNQKGVVERDLTKKEAYYVFQSYWSRTPMVRIYGHSSIRWGRPGELKPVRVYSNCQKAELFVNGKSCGVRIRDSEQFPCAGLLWETAFAPGVNQLRVIASTNEGVVVEDATDLEYQTEEWSAPSYLKLTADRVSDTVVHLEVKAYDERHIYCPDAAHFIRFSSAGEGRLIDNLGTARGSRYVQLSNGRAAIYAEHVKGGVLVVTAASDELKSDYTVMK